MGASASQTGPSPDGPSQQAVSPVPASVPCAWQPIETAPKDGTPIMLFSPDGHVGFGIIETVDYGLDSGPSVHGRTAAWAGQRPYETRPGIWMGGHSPLEATHWMPLPSPPEGV